MDKNFEVHPVEVKDYETIERFMIDDQYEHIAMNPELFCEYDQYFTREVFEDIIVDPRCMFEKVVDCRTKEVVGVVLAALEENDDSNIVQKADMFIYELYIVPAYRRKGLATELLKRAYDRGKEMGADNLSIDMYSDNAAAAEFYASFGFKERSRKLEVPIEQPEGTIAVFSDEKDVDEDHLARYELEHRMLPAYFYNSAAEFLPDLIDRGPGLMWDLMNDASNDMAYRDTDYSEHDFAVDHYQEAAMDDNGETVSLIHIGMPHPLVSNDCYDIYMVYSESMEEGAYFCVEYDEKASKDGKCFLCGWNGTDHYNYGLLDRKDASVASRIVDMFIGKESMEPVIVTNYDSGMDD